MFELSNLVTVVPTRYAHDWLCIHCHTVSLSRDACVSCGNLDYISYLDRRPLLLSKEVKNGVLDLIDTAVAQVPSLEIEEQLYYTGEYMPFLSGLLDDAEKADLRLAEGSTGFRSTDLPAARILELFSDMQLPPTS